jgi:hypothetical protein
MKTRGVVCTAASLVLAAASLALCALASTWGPQEGKRAELAEAQAVSPRLLEQVELARAVRLGECFRLSSASVRCPRDIPCISPARSLTHSCAQEERVIGIKSELAEAYRAGPKKRASPARPNLGGSGDLARIERQLAAVKALSGRAAADEAEAARARAAEARLKATVQAEIRQRRSEIANEDRSRSARTEKVKSSKMEMRAEKAKIRTWRAEQAKAWLKNQTAGRLSRLAGMEEADRPEIKKWTEEQTDAWKKARKSASEEDKINQALKHEASRIKLWRDQQEHATRKWREHASEKSESAKVRRAQETEHNLQSRAAQTEIRAITAEEMHLWRDERKKEAKMRIEKRAKRRVFGELESEDNKVERTLGADRISAKTPSQLREDRQVQEVEWKEENEQSKAKKVAQQLHDMRQSLETATLERKQAERQWEAMVKSAIGDGALAHKARRDPALVNQNLAQYLTHASAPSPHVWATAQAEID